MVGFVAIVASRALLVDGDGVHRNASTISLFARVTRPGYGSYLSAATMRSARYAEWIRRNWNEFLTLRLKVVGAHTASFQEYADSFARSAYRFTVSSSGTPTISCLLSKAGADADSKTTGLYASGVIETRLPRWLNGARGTDAISRVRCCHVAINNCFAPGWRNSSTCRDASHDWHGFKNYATFSDRVFAIAFFTTYRTLNGGRSR